MPTEHLWAFADFTGAEEELHPQQAYLKTLVPANSINLTPCLSREVWQAQYGSPMPAGAVFDDFGCRIDPGSGYRLPEDCFSPGVTHAPGTLCDPNLSGSHDAFARTDFADFLKTVLPFVEVLAPIIGQGLMKTLEPVFSAIASKLGDAGSSFLAKEMKVFTQALADAVARVSIDLNINLGSFNGKAFLDTIRKLGATAKSIAKAIRPPSITADIDPRVILSYANLREGLNFGGNLLAGDFKSIALLHDLSVKSALNVHDWDSARVWLDNKKTLAAMTKGLDLFKEQYGEASPDRLATVIVNTFPEADAQILRYGPSGDALSMSNRLSDAYSDQADKMIADYDPVKLASLVKEPALQRAMLEDMAQAATWDVMMQGPITQATQDYNMDLAALNGMLEQARRTAMSAPQTVPALQRAMREKIAAMKARADKTIRDASRVYQQPHEMGYSVSHS